MSLWSTRKGGITGTQTHFNKHLKEINFNGKGSAQAFCLKI